MTEIGLMIICVFITLCWLYTMVDKEKQIESERQQWVVERQHLLDRIQAPSFDHLKQAEVRIIRAQKEEKKEPPIELV